jgi:hypothetical protein
VWELGGAGAIYTAIVAWLHEWMQYSSMDVCVGSAHQWMYTLARRFDDQVGR